MIATISRVFQTTVFRLFKKAYNQGYNLEFDIKLRLKYVKDIFWLDALLKVTLKLEAAIIKAIKERNCKENSKPAGLLGYEHSIS